MPFYRKNKNMKKSSKFSKVSKSHKQNILQKKCKTVKNMKVMRGGSPQEDINNLFTELTTKKENGYFGLGKEVTNLDPYFFERDPQQRHGLILKAKWNNVINTQVNDRGQTPLYVLLRFGKSSQLIDILLKVPDIKVNRQNSDGSTALVGFCYGTNGYDVINWQQLSDLLKQFASKKADFTIANNNNETPFYWIKQKAEQNLIDYS
jgi:hypothetical protein